MNSQQMLFFALLWFIECYWSPAQVASMYSVLLGRYFRVTKYSTPASILMISTFKHWSAVNLVVSMTRCTDWWWTPGSCIPSWKPQLLTVSVFQGPEEATLPKMEAQHMQFTPKRYKYLSTFLSCLGFLHILPPTFVVYCWHTTHGWFLYNQHAFQPQYMSQFAYMGHCGYTWCLWEELNTGKTSSASREREDFKAKRSQLGTAPCCSLKMSRILLTAMKKHSAGENYTLNTVWLLRWSRGDESHKKYQEEQVIRMSKRQLEQLLTCAWWEANGLWCHGLGFSWGQTSRLSKASYREAGQERVPKHAAGCGNMSSRQASPKDSLGSIGNSLTLVDSCGMCQATRQGLLPMRCLKMWPAGWWQPWHLWAAWTSQSEH